MTDTIKELQAKIAYYYKRIDECNEEMKIIKNLTTKEGRKEGGYRRATQGKLETWDCSAKVLPKGWK